MVRRPLTTFIYDDGCSNDEMHPGYLCNDSDAADSPEAVRARPKADAAFLIKGTDAVFLKEQPMVREPRCAPHRRAERTLHQFLVSS